MRMSDALALFGHRSVTMLAVITDQLTTWISPIDFRTTHLFALTLGANLKIGHDNPPKAAVASSDSAGGHAIPVAMPTSGY